MRKNNNVEATAKFELHVRPLQKEDAGHVSDLMLRRFREFSSPQALRAHADEIHQASHLENHARGVGSFADPSRPETVRGFATYRGMEFAAEPGRQHSTKVTVRTLATSDPDFADCGIGLVTTKAGDLFSFATEEDPFPHLMAYKTGDPQWCPEFQERLGGVAFKADSFELASTPEFRGLDNFVRDRLRSWGMEGAPHTLGATNPATLISTAVFWEAAKLEPVFDGGHRRVLWRVDDPSQGRGGYHQVIAKLAQLDRATLDRLLTSTDEFWGRVRGPLKINY